VSVSICLNCPNLFWKIQTWVIFQNIESNIFGLSHRRLAQTLILEIESGFLNFILNSFTLAWHVSLCGLASWRVAGANRCLDSAQLLGHVNDAWRRFRKDHSFDVASISRIYFAKYRVFISRNIESYVCLKMYGLREHEFGISTHSCDFWPE
jgi:hypothetical protein